LRRARQITGGPAVELILDAIGGDSLKKGLSAPTGGLRVFGVSSGATNAERNNDDTESEIGREMAETKEGALHMFGRTIGSAVVFCDISDAEFILKWFDGGEEMREPARRK
jgi:hypothetical protein